MLFYFGYCATLRASGKRFKTIKDNQTITGVKIMTPLEIVLACATLLSIATGIFFSVRGATRDKTKDTKEDASQTALIMFKLDNIDTTVKEIKSDSKAFRMDIQDVRERLLVVEQEYKAIKPLVSDLQRIYFDKDKED